MQPGISWSSRGLSSITLQMCQEPSLRLSYYFWQVQMQHANTAVKHRAWATPLTLHEHDRSQRPAPGQPVKRELPYTRTWHQVLAGHAKLASRSGHVHLAAKGRQLRHAPPAAVAVVHIDQHAAGCDSQNDQAVGPVGFNAPDGDACILQGSGKLTSEEMRSLCQCNGAGTLMKQG